MRPESIAAIAARTLAEDRGDTFSVAVREFLDEFYAARNAARRPAMLADAPVPLSASPGRPPEWPGGPPGTGLSPGDSGVV